MAEQLHIEPRAIMPFINHSQHLSERGTAGKDLYRDALLFAAGLGLSMNTYTTGADGKLLLDTEVYAKTFMATLIAKSQAAVKSSTWDEHDYQVSLKQWAGGALEGSGEENQRVRSSIAQLAMEHARIVSEFAYFSTDKREGARRAASRMEESTEWRVNELRSRRAVTVRV